MHDHSGPVGIALGERIDDLAVMPHGTLQPFAAECDEPTLHKKRMGKVSDHLRQAPVPGSFDDCHVKLAVEIGDLFQVCRGTSFSSLFHLTAQGLECFELLVSDLSGRDTGTEPFQQGTHGGDFFEILGAPVGDPRTLVMGHHNEALRREFLQRIADGSSADTQLIRDQFFLDAVTGDQSARHDLCFQPVVGNVCRAAHSDSRRVQVHQLDSTHIGYKIIAITYFYCKNTHYWIQNN